MKRIIFLENNPSHLRIDYSKIYNPKKYQLFVIASLSPYQDLLATQRDRYCEKFYLINDFTIDRLYEVIIEIEKLYGKIHDIVTLEELSVRYCGRLRQLLKLELMHYDRFVDKNIMKQTLVEKIPSVVPQYLLFDRTAYLKNPEKYLDSIFEKLSFPLFVKPTEMVGSIEASKINNRRELSEWAIEKTKLDLQYELDEFIEGKLIHADSVIKNGKIIFTGVGINAVPCAEFFNGKPTGSYLLKDDDPLAERVRQFTVNIHLALGAPFNGVTHLEIFHKKNDQLVFLEIAYRPPGAYIPALHRTKNHKELWKGT